ncbi:MAG TPA: HD-GYP domain-containing protein [Thermoleophilaceae bacterium]|jgi:putative nucleotidyltransferase with HDIG domain
MKRIGIDTQPDLSPAVQELLEDFAGAVREPLRAREKWLALANSATYLAAATALAALLPSERTFEPVTALLLALAFALSKQVKFEVGVGYAVPSQLVFVPMLLLLPAGSVPLVVLAGMVLGYLPELLLRGAHPDRLLLAPGDCWYALGPTLVIGLSHVGQPGWGLWPVLLGALAAQLAFELVSGTLQDWLAFGVRPQLGFGLLGWVAIVDVLLAPVGLAGALASQHAPYAFLLLVPLVGLLWLFASERSTRIQHAIELGRAYRGTTLLLSDVLGADDEYTATHSHGVVALALEVASELGLGEVERRNVEFGALLHDVGKIAIPNEIINKPGPLDDDEWVVIKTHTVEGQRMLDRVGGVMGEVGQIVRSSHERWDGSGYPDRLAGEAIPFEARIVACCDAFSAMTTDRPYRKAMSIDDAVAELLANTGTQFDPRVVDSLLGVLGRVAAPPQVALNVDWAPQR